VNNRFKPRNRERINYHEPLQKEKVNICLFYQKLLLHKDKEAEKIGFPIDLIKLGKNFSEEIECCIQGIFKKIFLNKLNFFSPRQ
jgi:hypothetical protein